MADGRWQMADGKWQMANGRWQMADGRRHCPHHRGACPAACPTKLRHQRRRVVTLGRGPPLEGAAKRRKTLERSIRTVVGAQPGEVTSKGSCHL